jgi:hypothetical protein
MQRRIYCILFFLLIKVVSFSQSIKENISFQIDKIASSALGNKEFVVSAYLYNQIYIIKQTEDSLLVTSYSTMADNTIGRVYSVSVNDDTLLAKTVDSLFSDIKQNHNYQSYSKEILTGGNFFLTFYEKNKLQVFYDKKATPVQLTKVNYIVNSLVTYSIIPYSGHNRRLKHLHIQNWNELLKYLRNGSVESVSK